MKIRLNELEKALEEAEKYPETTIKGKVARKIVADAKVWLQNGMSIPVDKFPRLSKMMQQLTEESDGKYRITTRRK